MNETERRFLRRLRDAHPTGVPKSSIPQGCKQLVASLQTCGAVVFNSSSSGRGIVLNVVNLEAFDRFIGSRLPHGLNVDAASIPDRATAVRLLADAKAVRQALAEGVLVRSTKSAIMISAVDGTTTVNVSDQTAQAGACALQLSAEKQWTFVGTVAVVENTDAFWRHDVVLPDVDVAIHGHGNTSARLLKWLGSPAMAQCRVIHWGDYDPVGVYQYLRLMKECPGRVSAFAPEMIEILLPRYGKAKLISAQVEYLLRIRKQIADSYVQRMVGLFDKYRRGLEQEVLLKSEVLNELK